MPDKVFVYRNLNRKGFVFSIQDHKTKLVVGYTEDIILKDVEFRVSEASRQRVLKERQKNVHARVLGTPVETAPSGNWQPISYNPYRSGHFEDSSGKPVLSAQYFKVTPTGVFYRP